MANLSPTLEFLQGDTRKCSSCHEQKTAAYYSMQPNLFDQHPMKDPGNPLCNSCRIERHSFPWTRQDWSIDAACHLRNKPRHPESGIQMTSQHEVDLLMFPQSVADVRRRAWEPLCQACPVRTACAEWGETSGSSGVYGGEYRPAAGESAEKKEAA